MEEPRRPVVLEVSVRGELGAATLTAFPASRAASEGGVSVLSGVLSDQAALHGALGQLESMGLVLLGVRRNVDDPRLSNRSANVPVPDADCVQ